MPNLFEGWDDSEREDAIENIIHFLYSLPSEGNQPSPNETVFDTKKGEELFHSVGCVACHQPRRKPVKVEEDFEDEMDWVIQDSTADNSLYIPLPNLKEKTWMEPLAAFLSEPYKTRPGGRMPDMKITQEESVSIAAYLLEGEGSPPSRFRVDHAKARAGKNVFHEIGCTNCHSSAGKKEDYSLSAPYLTALSPGKGCLGEGSVKGIPDYQLTEEQRSHLSLALEELKAKPINPSASETIRHTLASLNCYGCHEREEVGGPTADRDPYFTGTWSEEMGEEGRVPPSLTGVGSKLTPKWLERTLFGEGGEVRLYLNTRMPHYETAQLGQLADLLAEVDEDPNPLTVDVSGILHHHRNHYGRELIGTDGLSCITCHNLNGQRSLGMPAVDLAVVPERLQPAWFKKLLLDPASINPNTRMPAFFSDGKSPAKLFGGDAGKQIEALWIYLKELDQTRLPVGMEKTDAFVLVPHDRPIIHRTFMKDVGPRTIAVGFPEKVHFAFDAEKCKVILMWRGAFLDAESAQADRFTPFVSPMGEDIHTFVAKKDSDHRMEESRFLGYRLDKSGVPIFLIGSGDNVIEETWVPLDDGSGFLRTVHVSGGDSIPVREEIRW